MLTSDVGFLNAISKIRSLGSSEGPAEKKIGTPEMLQLVSLDSNGSSMDITECYLADRVASPRHRGLMARRVKRSRQKPTRCFSHY